VVLCGFVNRSRQKESTKRDRWQAFVRMVHVLGVSLHDDGRLPRVRNRYRSLFITVAVSASGYQTIRSKNYTTVNKVNEERVDPKRTNSKQTTPMVTAYFYFRCI